MRGTRGGPLPDLAVAALLAAAPAGFGAEGTIVVEGQVWDLPWPELGAPALPAARVALVVEIQSTEGRLERSLESAADGRFRIELDDPGARPLAVEVRCNADVERRGAAAHATLAPGARAVAELVLERAGHGWLDGRVVDPRGRPLAGARVSGPPDESAGARELASDANGRFRIDDLRSAHPLRAELAGYASSGAVLPEPLPAGGWSPLELALQPIGRIELRVVTAEGAGLPELELSLAPRDPAALPLEAWGGMRALKWTDAAGRAVFEGVWAEMPIEIALFGADGFRWEHTRRVGSKLIAGSDAQGRAIELAAGEALALQLELGSPLSVRGRVLDAQGEPPLGTWYVHAAEVDPPGGGLSATSELVRRVEADGSFALRLFRGPHLGRLFVSLGLGAAAEQGTLAHELVDPARASDGVLEVSFVAADRTSIRGRVSGLGSEAAEFSVRALPSGLSRLQAEEVLGSERRASLEQDGGFELFDLPRGHYDLVVEERSASFGTVARSFVQIPAGSEGLELALQEEHDVHIRVRARVPDGDVESMIVLAGRSFPRLDLGILDGPPATSRHYAHPAPWPASVAPVPGRVQLVRDASAITSCMPFAAEGDELTLPPVGRGWYVLGVYARSASGERYAPVATEPLALGPGFHELVFDLRRTTRLTGRLIGGGPQECRDLRVMLLDEGGHPVALRKSMHSFTDRVRPKSDGTFFLHEVPLGQHRLLVGSDEELDAGRFRREILVNVRGEGDEVLTIELR